MKSLVNISTELNKLADYVGGNHLTNKEIESKLKRLSRDVFETSYEIRKITDTSTIIEATGISDKSYCLLKREENIKELCKAESEDKE